MQLHSIDTLMVGGSADFKVTRASPRSGARFELVLAYALSERSLLLAEENAAAEALVDRGCHVVFLRARVIDAQRELPDWVNAGWRRECDGAAGLKKFHISPWDGHPRKA
jgi:hypothetical protein